MKKIFTLTSLLLISATSLMAQADTASSAGNWVATPNPGFENWITKGTPSYTNPDGWNSANSQTAITGIFGCVKTASAKTGSEAVELITQSVLGITAPGIVTTGTVPTSSTGSITGGIAYTQRPDSIVGWYKCSPQSGDNGFATLFLFGSAANNADTVAVASFSTPITAVSTYTRFSAHFVYRNAHPVANSLWLLSSSNNTATAAVGSSAYFDELAVVINSTVGITTQTNPGNSIGVYPNPAKDMVTITNIANANTTLAVFDMTGRKVAEQKLVSGNNLIDVKTFTNGLYIYTLTDENNAPVKTGKLIIQK